MLSGPIDHAKDDGVGWRQQFAQLTAKLGIKLRILDPCNKPVGGHSEIGEEKKHTFELRRQGKFAQVAQIVKEFRYQDLRMVDLSDFMVVYIDPTIHSSGTYEELYRARSQRKPIFAIVNGGRTNTPLWLLDDDVFPNWCLFHNVEDCVAHIHLIHTETCWIDKAQWVFARDFLDETGKIQQILTT